MASFLHIYKDKTDKRETFMFKLIILVIGLFIQNTAYSKTTPQSVKKDINEFNEILTKFMPLPQDGKKREAIIKKGKKVTRSLFGASIDMQTKSGLLMAIDRMTARLKEKKDHIRLFHLPQIARLSDLEQSLDGYRWYMDENIRDLQKIALKDKVGVVANYPNLKRTRIGNLFKAYHMTYYAEFVRYTGKNPEEPMDGWMLDELKLKQKFYNQNTTINKNTLDDYLKTLLRNEYRINKSHHAHILKYLETWIRDHPEKMDQELSMQLFYFLAKIFKNNETLKLNIWVNQKVIKVLKSAVFGVLLDNRRGDYQLFTKKQKNEIINFLLNLPNNRWGKVDELLMAEFKLSTTRRYITPKGALSATFLKALKVVKEAPKEFIYNRKLNDSQRKIINAAINPGQECLKDLCGSFEKKVTDED